MLIACADLSCGLFFCDLTQGLLLSLHGLSELVVPSTNILNPCLGRRFGLCELVTFLEVIDQTFHRLGVSVNLGPGRWFSVRNRHWTAKFAQEAEEKDYESCFELSAHLVRCRL